MFDVTLLILLGLAALGFVSHNTTVAVSILVLIIVRVTPLNTFFPWIEKQGLTVGIIILTIGVMAPIASGTLPLHAHPLLCELEITGRYCHRGIRLGLAGAVSRSWVASLSLWPVYWWVRYWAWRYFAVCRWDRSLRQVWCH